ncbi:nucleotidyl transferase AbiEii/AbiGii toxin family protein [Mycolicibacterium sp.]|uniref:nucleotidyl transferase AbiEii/AbiGii toxin family protein n=1 Tax=Mycolicibacterium sp. TaxID=2320850 RepID=UPI0037CC2398
MDAFHARAARVALAVLSRYGFVLAGGYAVQVHGIGDRLSEDVDLFTDQSDVDKFRTAAAAAVEAWEADGIAVTLDEHSGTFARFYLADGRQRMKAELSHDWRADPPVVLDVGPVLSRDDSVASKVIALFARGEARDYIDIYAAESSGAYTRRDLEALAAARDLGFNIPAFAQSLRASSRHDDSAYAAYGLSGGQIAALRSAMSSWADDIESR